MSYEIGVWLSLVERLVRDQEVGCSNHLTPTRESLVDFCSQGFLLCVDITVPESSDYTDSFP